VSGDALELVTFAFAAIGPPVVFAWIAWEAWRLVAPAWYIARGDYARGRHASLALARSWWRRAPGVEASSLYNAALCDIGEGILEPALTRLEAVPLEGLDENLRYAFSSAIGVTLVLLERDPLRARDVLEEAVALRATTNALLALAHARWMAGDVSGARKAFEQAEKTPLPSGPKLGRKTMLWFDKATLAAQVDLLRGWFLVRLARFDDAKASLSRAIASPFESVYRSRARALLERVRTGTTYDEDAPPSSIGPLVIP
jgi:hypothetical protein